MNIDELEQRLENGVETQSFEVKGPMNWDASSLAKDFLAMANVRDGGFIVIGVEDETFRRIGVTEEAMSTFVLDTMRDQMAKFADPHVTFSVTFPRDIKGTTFVAIRVEPFNQIPVICRKNGNDVKEGAIYYRNTNKRVQSAQISNSYDMRDLILMAAARTNSYLANMGLVLNQVDDSQKQFDDELEGL